MSHTPYLVNSISDNDTAQSCVILTCLCVADLDFFLLLIFITNLCRYVECIKVSCLSNMLALLLVALLFLLIAPFTVHGASAKHRLQNTGCKTKVFLNKR